MNKGNIDNSLKIEYHKKMINQRVFVLSGNFYGCIKEIIDDENFKIISDNGEEKEVSGFDIRSIIDEK